MKNILTAAIFGVLMLTAAAPQASAQEPEQPNIDEIIANQLENLERMFKLDDVQIFFVDSILQANFPAMMEEFENTQKAGAANAETFQLLSDKWMDRTDRAFEKVFTPEQWTRYMKSTYGKEKKKRDKRLSERNFTAED